jgi:hypothetical protein
MELMNAYKKYSNDMAMSAVIFAEQMEERGFKRKRMTKGMVWLYLRIADDDYW